MAKCTMCGICCKTSPIRLEQVNYDLKWVEGRGGRVVGEHVYVPSVCKWVTKDNKCAVQNDKPPYCKLFPLNVGPQPWLLNMGCRFFNED